MSGHVLEIRNLTVAYGVRTAVLDMSFSLPAGKTAVIVGESGSGKSTVLQAVLGLLPPEGRVCGGSIFFEGTDLRACTETELLRLRGSSIGMIFQNAGTHLNPRRRIGSQFEEMLRAHGKSDSRAQWAWDGMSKFGEVLRAYRKPAEARVCRPAALFAGISGMRADAKALKRTESEVLTALGLSDPERVLRAYPFQLSGGMCQRVSIAMAMSLHPKLLLADEPTSALDVTAQAQVLRQLLALRRAHGTSMLVVTHSMGVAACLADYIAVMRKGVLREFGTREQVLNHPADEYTRFLLRAVPKLRND